MMMMMMLFHFLRTFSGVKFVFRSYIILYPLVTRVKQQKPSNVWGWPKHLIRHGMARTEIPAADPSVGVLQCPSFGGGFSPPSHE